MGVGSRVYEEVVLTHDPNYGSTVSLEMLFGDAELKWGIVWTCTRGLEFISRGGPQ